MLVLSVKVGESITLGESIKVYLLEKHGSTIRIGIEAPKEVFVRREGYNKEGNDTHGGQKDRPRPSTDGAD